MKKLSLAILLPLLTLVAMAQNPVSLENSVNYFNDFQRTREEKPDSAMYFLDKLAISNPSSIEDLLHNSFAQGFLNMFDKISTNEEFLARLKKDNISLDSARRKFKEIEFSAYSLLERMGKDSITVVKDNAYPIAQWVEAQKNSKNPDKLLEIGNRYLGYLNATNDFYLKRKARYGLLIANIIASTPNLKTTAEKLQQVIYTNLQNRQTEGDANALSRKEKEERAWYRYMFAYTNYISAKQHLQDNAEHVNFLKMAAQYSPDNVDKTVSHAYFYDMFFLLGKEKYSFEEDYLTTLENDEEKIKVLMEMSFKDPSYKLKAKTFYKDKEKFNEYWLNEFNNKHRIAPVFSLKQLDGNQYTLNEKKGQWTLIDFWGTWCAPCRAEHPDLQKLYQKTKDGQLAKLNIITIATDVESAVNGYMKEFNYSFPVAMSDNEIEKKYAVSSWPSKFLVSPQGKYVIIPFNVDWQKYIVDYIN